MYAVNGFVLSCPLSRLFLRHGMWCFFDLCVQTMPSTPCSYHMLPHHNKQTNSTLAHSPCHPRPPAPITPRQDSKVGSWPSRNPNLKSMEGASTITSAS